MKKNRLNILYALISLLIIVVLTQSFLLYDFKNEISSSHELKAQESTGIKGSLDNQFFNNFQARSSDPFEQMQKMQELMQQSFAQFNSVFQDDPFFKDMYQNIGTLPLSDLKDDGDNYILELSIPGARKEDIKILINDNILSVNASTQKSKDINNTNYIRQERFVQKFVRSFTLPENADHISMTYTYKDGILKILIPKKQ